MHASDRLFLIAVPAAVLASVDLVVKLKVPTESWAYHRRSDEWVALSVGVLLGAFSLALVRSSAVALAAGVMCGGVIGNLVSARADGNWVPNPLVIANYDRILAFNLADVFFVVGELSLMATLMIVAMRSHQSRLLSPVTLRRGGSRQQ
jgi:lipoprotein signal peptidase